MKIRIAQLATIAFVLAACAGTDTTDADTDGDGFNDGAEVAAETDPLDPFDFPAVLVPALGPRGIAVRAALLGAVGVRWSRRRAHRPGSRRVKQAH